MKHRIEIDGLRAFAILPVLLFHAGVPFISGGFLGVDVFFVISGFLITGIIVNELQTKNSFSITNFYERRIRRLFPALFVVCAVTTILAWLVLFPNEYNVFRVSERWLTFFVSNVFFLGQNDYFDPNIDLNPMLHTWSLAVEEQFYIFFPLVLWVFWKFIPRKLWISLLVVASIVSLVWSQNNWFSDQSATFYLVQFRAWELSAGAMAAIYLSNRPKHNLSNNWIGTGSLLVLLVSFFTVNASMPHPGFITVPSVAATVGVLLFAGRGTVAYRILSNRTIVWVGLISYSAYLWHQPLFAIYRSYRTTQPAIWEFLPIIASVLLISHLSWKYVENPFRNKSQFPRKKLFTLVSLATIALLVSTVVIRQPLVASQSFSSPTPTGTKMESAQKITERLIENYGLGRICKDALENQDECTSGPSPKVALWGDSFAMHLSGALLDSPTKTPFIQQTMSTCSPVLGLAPQNPASNKSYGERCIERNEKFFRYLIASEIETVVLASNWTNILGPNVRLLDSRDRVFNADDQGQKALSSLIEKLQANGKRVVVVLSPPFSGEELGNCIRKSIVFNGNLNNCNFDSSKNQAVPVNKTVSSASAKANLIVDLETMLCPDGKCLVTRDGVFIYRDHYHLSIEGSAYLGKTYDFMGQVLGR